ncbi:hypothetical protein Slin14017_G126340 [Septoria linicola]|nr:hypothetical protein Slin14017_G126340 [Septoria linicola]
MIVVRAVRVPLGQMFVPWTSTGRPRVITDCDTSNRRQYTTASKPRGFAIAQRIGPWAPEEDAMLASLHGQMNKPMVVQVSEELKRSVQAVRTRYYQLYPIREGNKSRPWTAEENEALTRLYSTRISVPDIARQLGRSVSAVHRRRRRMGIAADRLKPQILYTPVMDETIIRMHKLKHTWRAVGAQLGLDWADVRNRGRNHLGLRSGRAPAGTLVLEERGRLLNMLRAGQAVGDIAKEIGIKESYLVELIKDVITYRHEGGLRVRRHATALYLHERKTWRWREIAAELKTDESWLSKVYAYSSFEVYKDLVIDEDPRLWDDAKLARITKIVADRVTTRNTELGIPKRKARRDC